MEVDGYMAYGIIVEEIWHDQWFKGLGGSEQLFWVWLLTNERRHMAGIYQVDMEYATIPLHCAKEDVEKWAARFEKDEKIVMMDGWVMIATFLRHNRPPNESCWRHVLAQVQKAPSLLRDKWLALNHERLEKECPHLLKGPLTPCPQGVDTVPTPCGHGEATVQTGCGESGTGTGTEQEQNRTEQNDVRTSPQRAGARAREGQQVAAAAGDSVDGILPPPVDPLGYMNAGTEAQQVVEEYRAVWKKPNYKPTASAINAVMDKLARYGMDGVRKVLHKSREGFDAGEKFYGENGALGSLMADRMFEHVLESEPARRGRQSKPASKRIR